MDSHSNALIPLHELLALQPTASANAAIVITLRRNRRALVWLLNRDKTTPEYSGAVQRWFGTFQPCCGDAPDKVHPKFVMAVLSSRAASGANRDSDGAVKPLPQWSIPHIAFNTDEFVRRSMTLNGMRMTTEYFGSGSTRVLRLIEERIKIGQRDVVHDVLVYLGNQILDIRAEAFETRALRAEAVAAYLGVNQSYTEMLFQQPRLTAARLTRQIKGAGLVRRQIDVAALMTAQLQHLQPAIDAAARAEKRAMRLVDRIAALLY